MNEATCIHILQVLSDGDSHPNAQLDAIGLLDHPDDIDEQEADRAAERLHSIAHRYGLPIHSKTEARAVVNFAIAAGS